MGMLALFYGYTLNKPHDNAADVRYERRNQVWCYSTGKGSGNPADELPRQLANHMGLPPPLPLISMRTHYCGMRQKLVILNQQNKGTAEPQLISHCRTPRNCWPCLRKSATKLEAKYMFSSREKIWWHSSEMQPMTRVLSSSFCIPIRYSVVPMWCQLVGS